MKKLILTSATVLFIGLTAFAQDGGKCTKKCEKKCSQKECAYDTKCNKKCEMTACTADMKCAKENKNCVKVCKVEGEKKATMGSQNK